MTGEVSERPHHREQHKLDQNSQFEVWRPNHSATSPPQIILKKHIELSQNFVAHYLLVMLRSLGIHHESLRKPQRQRQR